MERENVIRKVAACLRLAASPGATEAEAARALKQAQAMMEKHGLTEQGITAAQATESRSRTVQNTPPIWSIHLRQIVARAFGVTVILNRSWSTHYAFIGIAPAPEVAEYAWAVLDRQLVKARTQHIAALPKRLKRKTKTRRGDLFARAWVAAVSANVRAFAGADQSRAIAAYQAEHYPALATARIKGIDPKHHDWGSAAAGRDSAAGVRLDRPMGADAKPAALESQQ